MACSCEILFSSFTYLCVCVRIIYSLTEDKPFEYFILLTIFVNCILLAANTPLPNSDKSDLNQKLVSRNLEISVHNATLNSGSFCGRHYYTCLDGSESHSLILVVIVPAFS